MGRMVQRDRQHLGADFDRVWGMAMNSAKDIALAKAWAIVRQPVADEKQGLPAKTWATIPMRTRAILVMLGGASMEDPREVARRPWESLSLSDKERIGAVARDIRKDLQAAACLF